MGLRDASASKNHKKLTVWGGGVNPLRTTLFIFQVTGIDINAACVTIFIVCVFYTTAGGFKAVRNKKEIRFLKQQKQIIWKEG